MEEEKKDAPENSDQRQVSKKTSLDETLEAADRLCAQDMANNVPAINVLIINYIQSAREAKELKTRLDVLNLENRDFYSKLAVANASLELKEFYDKKLSAASAIGGALLFFSAFVEGKIYKLDIRIVLSFLGLALLCLGMFGNLFRKVASKKDKNGD